MAVTVQNQMMIHNVSDTEHNWDRLKKGTKIKRLILQTVALYIFCNVYLKNVCNKFVVALHSKLIFPYLVVTS